MKTIKIAPSVDEIIVKENGHIFEAEFNGLRTEFVLNGKATLNKSRIEFKAVASETTS